MNTIANTIIRAAMQGATEAHCDLVEEATWTDIESLDQDHAIEAINFATDAGILSIESKFNTTDNRSLTKLLWNEFGDDIDVVAQDIPAWKREIVDTPRAKKPATPEWHGVRLRAANLPLLVSRVQIGEVSGGSIEWTDVYRDVDVEWDDENGIVTDIGYCFLGWDADRQVYLGTRDTLENNDTVARIAL